MSATSLIAFTAVLALTYATPGPDFAIILRYASHGRRWGRLAAFGVLVGMCVHVTAATAGLSAVLTRSATAFTVLKAIGPGTCSSSVYRACCAAITICPLTQLAP